MQQVIIKRQCRRHNILQISRYLILTAILSFIGWLYEVFLVRFKYGHWSDRGFLWLPFCPIYGGTLVFVYFFMGTPKEKRGILKKIENPYLHTALYLFFAFLIPTIAELSVALFFDKTFHLFLWNYAKMPLNFHGYISIPVSVLWSALIYIFMRFFFTPLQKLVAKIPKNIAAIFAVVLCLSVIMDAVIQFITI